MAKNARFRGDIWFSQEVHIRTKQAMIEQERCFVQEHENDTELQLIEYVCQTAAELGHTPQPREIIGGKYIAMRLDGWENVVRIAGLSSPGTMPHLQNRMIYRREYERQAVLFKRERTEAKFVRKTLVEVRSVAAAQEKQARLERDLAWGDAHKGDTDQQLLDYLRQCAVELGHSPVTREVVGGAYISKRFGSWPMVLTCAGLELPQGMKPPKEKDKVPYRELLLKQKAAQMHC